MRVEKHCDIPLEDAESTLVAACLSAENEVVVLLDSGNVVRFGFEDGVAQHLFSTNDFLAPGFSLSVKCTFYTLDDIVVLVNDYGLHGFVYRSGRGVVFRPWRKDYHAQITSFPIALYKDQNGVPHLIYSEAWNHTQIMNLDTLEILTATKSLIEEGEKERILAWRERDTEGTLHPFPTPYDYFYGKLLMSPDCSRFLSKGWVWGSADSYSVYDLEDFVANSRISERRIGVWEHLNRAACWIGEETVAVAYNAEQEDNNNVVSVNPTQLRFYNINDLEREEYDSFDISAFVYSDGELLYSRKFDAVIAFNGGRGLAVYSLAGNLLLHDERFAPTAFYPEFDLFLTVEDKVLTIHRLMAD